MAASPIDRWIRQSLRSEPPRAKSLVMTVFGDAIAPYGGALWLGSLIALLRPLGLSDRLVRTSVFRLVDEGWLVASRSGRRSLYRLSEQAERRFLRAHRRVYAPTAGDWNGLWTLVTIGAEMADKAQRNALKKALMWEGFAEIAPGLLAFPGRPADALADALASTGCAGKALVFEATDAGLSGSAALATQVNACWDLGHVRQAYRQFVRRHTPLAALLDAEPPDDEQAFCVRTLLIHAYRRVQLQDPQLPAALLDDDWPGMPARGLCRALYQQVAKTSERHIRSALELEAGEAPVPAERLSQRFAD